MSSTAWIQIYEMRMRGRYVSWIIPESGGTALCIRQDDASHHLGDMVVLRGWQSHFEDAVREGLRGLRMISGAFHPYNPEPCDALYLHPRLSPPPGHEVCLIFSESELEFVETPFFPTHGCVWLVCYRGREYVYKCILDPKYAREGGELQNELDINFVVRESPHVLPVAALISQVSYQPRPSLSDEDPRPNVTPQTIVCGFLVPFMGATTRLWYPFEWSVEEKLVLMTGLIRAVASIESMGVNLTDLKQPNVLLTPDGLKLIDLNTVTCSKGYCDDSGRWQAGSSKYTLHNLGKTIVELFTEMQPPPESPRLPKSVSKIVQSCFGCRSGTTNVHSVNELLSVFHSQLSSWDGTGTLVDLHRKRWAKLQVITQSPAQSWYGICRRTTGSVESWSPVFKASNGFRTLILRKKQLWKPKS